MTQMTRGEAERFVRSALGISAKHHAVVQWRSQPPEGFGDWLTEHGIEPTAFQQVDHSWAVVPDASRSSGFRAIPTRTVTEARFANPSDALLCYMAFSEEASEPFDVPATPEPVAA